jgi:hypothetical protein
MGRCARTREGQARARDAARLPLTAVATTRGARARAAAASATTPTRTAPVLAWNGVRFNGSAFAGLEARAVRSYTRARRGRVTSPELGLVLVLGLA